MMGSIINAVDRAIWVQVPRLAARLSDILGVTLADGQYLRRARSLALLLPILALMLGFLIGATHSEWFGFGSEKRAFSASLFLTLFALTIGALSAQLSLLLLLGYMVADIAIFQVMSDRDSPVGFYAGLLLSYILFAQLISIIPVIARAIGIVSVAGITGTQRPKVRLRLALLLGSSGVAMAVLTYAWIAAFPYLIRPVHVLTGRWVDIRFFIDSRMTLETVRPIQIQIDGAPSIFHPLMIAGVLALVFRLAVEALWRIERQPEGGVLSRHPVRSWPILISAPLKAAFSTFILSGMFSHLYQAFMTYVAFLALFVIGHFRVWQNAALAKHMMRVPLIFRFLVALALTWGVTALLLPALMFDFNSFTPMIVTIIIGAGIFAFIMPQPASPNADAPE